jgi:hypothetical protein
LCRGVSLRQSEVRHPGLGGVRNAGPTPTSAGRAAAAAGHPPRPPSGHGRVERASRWFRRDKCKPPGGPRGPASFRRLCVPENTTQLDNKSGMRTLRTRSSRPAARLEEQAVSGAVVTLDGIGSMLTNDLDDAGRRTEDWRKRDGIEPSSACSRPTLVLKTRGTTRHLALPQPPTPDLLGFSEGGKFGDGRLSTRARALDCHVALQQAVPTPDPVP